MPTIKNHLIPTHSEIVKAGMAAKARTGIPTGPVPLGYRKVRRDEIVVVEIDEEAAPLVQEAFRLACLKTYSLRRILTLLERKSLKSQRGKDLSATALWRILTNRFYIGTVRYCSEEVDGIYTPLVDSATFNQVQTNLNIRRRQ